MAAWHRSVKADLGLRVVGLILCGMAYLAIARLFALHPPAPPKSAGALAYGLATIGFLGGSVGGAMTTLGHHLFDEIEISDRWRRADLGRYQANDR